MKSRSHPNSPRNSFSVHWLPPRYATRADRRDRNQSGLSGSDTALIPRLRRTIPPIALPFCPTLEGSTSSPAPAAAAEPGWIPCRALFPLLSQVDRSHALSVSPGEIPISAVLYADVSAAISRGDAANIEFGLLSERLFYPTLLSRSSCSVSSHKFPPIAIVGQNRERWQCWHIPCSATWEGDPRAQAPTCGKDKTAVSGGGAELRGLAPFASPCLLVSPNNCERGDRGSGGSVSLGRGYSCGL